MCVGVGVLLTTLLRYVTNLCNTVNVLQNTGYIFCPLMQELKNVALTNSHVFFSASKSVFFLKRSPYDAMMKLWNVKAMHSCIMGICSAGGALAHFTASSLVCWKEE